MNVEKVEKLVQFDKEDIKIDSDNRKSKRLITIKENQKHRKNRQIKQFGLKLPSL